MRQGCPLAQVLYLVVGEALRFLAARGLGITVGGQRIVASQFSDDVQVLLDGPAAVPALLDALRVFGDASGQRLNAAKTQVMLVGGTVETCASPGRPSRWAPTAPGGSAASSRCTPP